MWGLERGRSVAEPIVLPSAQRGRKFRTSRLNMGSKSEWAPRSPFVVPPRFLGQAGGIWRERQQGVLQAPGKCGTVLPDL